MKQLKIMFNSVSDVKDFVQIVDKYAYDVELSSDKYHVDGKSIMGIFSLDLSKPVTVLIKADYAEDLVGQIQNYIVQ